MKTKHIASSFIALLLMAACAPRTIAQQIQPPTPTAHECRVLANQLGSDPRSEAFRRALGANIAGCGDIGAAAVANAFLAARSVRDAGFADRFQLAIAYNRSPVLLKALLSVVEDRGSTCNADRRDARRDAAARPRRRLAVFCGSPGSPPSGTHLPDRLHRRIR